MSAWFDCADEAQRAAGLAAATTAVLAGELVVLPTDTVYGVGADAFSPDAVRRLLAAKGRGRDMPPPVLFGNRNAWVELLEQSWLKIGWSLLRIRDKRTSTVEDVRKAMEPVKGMPHN